ncbi:unnamed protein product, partial [marine sediment metagenome]
MEARQADEVFTVSPSPIPEPESADAKGGGVRRLRLFSWSKAMNTNDKVPWTELRAELRDRDDRLEKLFCAKFQPVQQEVQEMRGQLTQICELSADNEDRIGKLETAAKVAKAAKAV